MVVAVEVVGAEGAKESRMAFHMSGILWLVGRSKSTVLVGQPQLSTGFQDLLMASSLGVLVMDQTCLGCSVACLVRAGLVRGTDSRVEP